MCVQVDNALEGTRMPVALSVEPPTPDDEPGDDGPSQACLHIALTHNLRWSSSTFVYLDHVDVLLHTLQLQLEQNLVARLTRFFHTLSGVDAGTPEGEYHEKGESLGGRSCHIRVDDPNMATDPPTESPLELYFRELRLHPVSVKCTVQMEALCSPAELQPYHPTNSLAGLARRLVSLNNSHLQLSALLLSDTLFQSLDTFVERVSWHYTIQVRGCATRVGCVTAEAPFDGVVPPPAGPAGRIQTHRLTGPHRQPDDALC